MQSLFSQGGSVAQTKRTDHGPLVVSPDKANLIQEYILEWLAFKSMKDREDEVASAHRKTFEWIFAAPESINSNPQQSTIPTTTTTVPKAPERSDFGAWLAQDSDRDRIYWISGKPGSGKSTLMRFIYDHERTRDTLKGWAEPMELTMAGFFFWTSGSFDQRSQAGLLRSLLHQLLNQHRDMIAMVFPDVWHKACSATTQERIKTELSWDLEGLMSGFRAFLRNVADKTKIFLSIDGLDEFDGDKLLIVEFFQDIIRECPSLKVCLSSRPWDVFEKAFQHSVPTLRLQDLTHNDMAQYVDDKLAKDPRVRRIVRKEPEAGLQFIIDVVNKADGVFLWVTLAVRSLLQDLKADDTVLACQQRLAQLPSDLDALFRHTLFIAQPQEQLNEASRIFQLVRAREVVCDFTRDETASAMTLWELALAESGEKSFALEDGVHEISTEVLLKICNGTQGRLVHGCAGLLEVHIRKSYDRTDGLRFAKTGESDDNNKIVHLASGKVTYLHRTVRDFLMYQSGVWADIEQQTSGSNFDPHINHLLSFVLKLKLPFEEPEKHRRLDEWWPDIVSAMTHARYIKTSSIPQQRELLLEFDRTLSWYWAPRKSIPNDHWARSAFASYEERNKSPIHAPFLALATKFNIGNFVLSQLKAQEDEYEGGASILSYAVEFLIHRRSTVYPLSTVQTVEILLRSGADPNQSYSILGRKGQMETPWLKALRLVREANRRGWIMTVKNELKDGVVEDDETKRWTDILILLVRGGADVNLVIAADSWDPEINALGIFEEVLQKSPDRRIMDVRNLLIENGAMMLGQSGADGELKIENDMGVMKI
jgi:hypothetical protein